MDVFAHGLWAWIFARFANSKLKKKLNVWLAVIFGVMPDVVSFAPLFVFLIFGLITGTGTFPQPEGLEPAGGNTLFIHDATSFLYSLTHSIAVFLLAFFLVWLVFRKPLLEMAGWLLHILIDIPTHSYQFYPTPFLWPFSGWKFDGISWASPWFMVLNYSLIAAAFIYLRFLSGKHQQLHLKTK